MTNVMTSPPVPQAPKQCQLCRSGETMNEGVFSLWKGQGALNVRPAFCSGTYLTDDLDDVEAGLDLLDLIHSIRPLG